MKDSTKIVVMKVILRSEKWNGREHKIGLERIDEFISRSTDFEYPGKNENKRASYYDSIKKKRFYHFKLSKRKPSLQFLLMKASHSVKFFPVLKVKSCSKP